MTAWLAAVISANNMTVLSDINRREEEARRERREEEKRKKDEQLRKANKS